MTPPQEPSERCFTCTRGPRTSVAVKRAPFPEATTMPPVGSKSGEAALLGLALDPALLPAQASVSIASETNVVRNMRGVPPVRLADSPRAEASSIAEGRSCHKVSVAVFRALRHPEGRSGVVEGTWRLRRTREPPELPNPGCRPPGAAPPRGPPRTAPRRRASGARDGRAAPPLSAASRSWVTASAMSRRAWSSLVRAWKNATSDSRLFSVLRCSSVMPPNFCIRPSAAEALGEHGGVVGHQPRPGEPLEEAEQRRGRARRAPRTGPRRGRRRSPR